MSDFHAGVFLIDKPIGPTSFTVVRWVRKLLGIKKVGHAGTLDPFASGLLIVCAGRPATKMISSFMDGDKEYFATLCLGRETSTMDPEGEIIAESTVGLRTTEEIEKCLASFRGEQMQQPPAYSALKHEGKPLYYYARKGIEVKKDPRKVHIKELARVGSVADLTGDFPQLEIKVTCSKGTYIRSLASDIGDALGCGAYLTALRRTRSGPFHVENSIDGQVLSTTKERETLLKSMLSVEDVANLLQ